MGRAFLWGLNKEGVGFSNPTLDAVNPDRATCSAISFFRNSLFARDIRGE
jgi:hypothetical protein